MTIEQDVRVCCETNCNLIVYIQPSRDSRLLSRILAYGPSFSSFVVAVNPVLQYGLGFTIIFTGPRKYSVSDDTSSYPSTLDLKTIYSAYESLNSFQDLDYPYVVVDRSTASYRRAPWSQVSNGSKAVAIHIAKKGVYPHNGGYHVWDLFCGSGNAAKLQPTFQDLISRSDYTLNITAVDRDTTKIRDRLGVTDLINMTSKRTHGSSCNVQVIEDQVENFLANYDSAIRPIMILMTHGLSQVSDPATAYSILDRAYKFLLPGGSIILSLPKDLMPIQRGVVVDTPQGDIYEEIYDYDGKLMLITWMGEKVFTDYNHQILRQWLAIHSTVDTITRIPFEPIHLTTLLNNSVAGKGQKTSIKREYPIFNPKADYVIRAMTYYEQRWDLFVLHKAI
jgi:hypothetical protein